MRLIITAQRRPLLATVHAPRPHRGPTRLQRRFTGAASQVLKTINLQRTLATKRYMSSAFVLDALNLAELAWLDAPLAG